ncbi:MAG: glycogen synthase GlgA [Acidobacteriota bacterium]
MSLRIAHVASEVVPFSKTGGLADVVGALPPALAALGHRVTVVAPAHRSAMAEAVPGARVGELTALGMRAGVHLVEHEGVDVLLLDCPQLFVRPALYSLPDGDFPDNPIRFAFFARAALAAVAARGGADVVHVHDWQAALAPLLLATEFAQRDALPDARSVITIHNLAYQGVFRPWVLDACELPARLFTIDLLEFYGQVNFLKGGLAAADAVTTVSPTYAREILTPEFGCGLEGVLATRRGALTGIVNGLDLRVWDPRRDAALPRPFSATDAAAGKQAAREALAAEVQLAPGDRPIAGMVSRLAEQKGADVVAAAVDQVVALGYDLVILGTGERRFEETLQAAEVAHPGHVRVVRRFDERLAHLIYAGSAVFLMPSRYEPCGLGQMIAMRYGTMPVVTSTGGLADTVVDADRTDGTGIVFADLSPSSLVTALERARRVLDTPRRLREIRSNAMGRDFSWDASARRYAELYAALAPGA